METKTFAPSFAKAVLENILVVIGVAIGTPAVMLARAAAHPGMTLSFAVKAGLLGGVLSFLYYTVRFWLRVPGNVSVSESDLVLQWRNGKETRVRWDDVRRGVFRARWGYRWKFFLDDCSRILWGDGFSAETWEQISGLVEAQLAARGVAMEKYDPFGKRIA